MGGQAFTGKRLQGFWKDPNEFVLVGIDTDDGEGHPLYDKRLLMPLKEETVLSIMEHGVIQPVLVQNNGGQAEVLDGRRRIQHAREANKRLRKAKMTPVQVSFLVRRPRSDAERLGIGVMANELREDDSMMQKAEKAEHLANLGQEDEAIAGWFGVSAQTIRSWRKLLDASSKIHKAIENGKISATAATKLARMKREKQDEALAEMIESGNTTVAAAADRNRAASGKTPKASSTPSRSTLRALVKEGAEALDEDTLAVLKWVADGGKAPKSLRVLLRKVS